MKEEKICGIYMITSPSRKIYIGYTKNIYNRWRHYRNLDCKNQIKLYHSFLKYGVENHKFEIIEVCSYEVLKEREIHYIALHNTHHGEHGLNLTDGGGGASGYKCSDETKEKLRKIHKGRIKSKEEMEKTRISNTGQKRTEESKEKMRKAKLKVKDEIAQRTRNYWANLDPEKKKEIYRKVGEKNKGRKKSHETIELHRQKCKGQKRSKEQIENMRKGRKNRPHSEEHKAFFL